MIITDRKMAVHVYYDDIELRFEVNFVGMIDEIRNYKTWFVK